MAEYEKGSVLRCGRCWRNLATTHGQEMHTVFPDGSMRCEAPEGKWAYVEVDDAGGSLDVPYTSTRVVLDCEERTARLSEVANVVFPHG